MEKLYIKANDLLQQSYQLGLDIIKSEFRPDFIVAIWRGGTPVGIAVQELMEYHGWSTNHIAIRTSSYNNLKRVEREVRVHNLGYLIDTIKATDNLLIIDDVFDTGRSVEAVLNQIKLKARLNAPKSIRIATPYFKPNKNQTEIMPDYFITKTQQWLVFPHEVCGLTQEEISQNKPEFQSVMSQLSEIETVKN